MSRNTEGFVPFALPSFDEEEERAVIEVLRSGWVTTGRVAREFEAEFADRVGAAHALAVSSATAGLHLALEAAGVGPGDRVATSPFTFTATAEVVRYLGAHPVFVDIDERSLDLDPEGLAGLLEEGTKPPVKAVVPVHVGGLVCEMEAITAAADHYGAAVIEDAAHALPATRAGRHAGTFGDAGVFSFYATKTITTGEGGMLVTDREDIARRAAVMRLHGIDREVWDRYTAPEASWRYEVVEAGYKYNMTDLAAAIGRVQLRKAERFHRRRREIAARYLEAFADADYLRLPRDDPGHSWHLFTLRIVADRLDLTRDEYVAKLKERGIGTSVHYIPLHIMPYYRRLYGYQPGDYPRALAAYRTIFSLPIYPDLEDEEVERIVTAVLEVGAKHYHR